MLYVFDSDKEKLNMSKKISLSIKNDLWDRVAETGLTRSHKDQDIIKDAIALWAYMHKKRITSKEAENLLDEYYRPEAERLEIQKRFDEIISIEEGTIKELLKEILIDELEYIASINELDKFGVVVVRKRNEIFIDLKNKKLPKSIKNKTIKKYMMYSVDLDDHRTNVRFH